MLEPLPNEDAVDQQKFEGRFLSGVFLYLCSFLIPLVYLVVLYKTSQLPGGLIQVLNPKLIPLTPVVAILVLATGYVFGRRATRRISINLRRLGRKNFLITDAQDALSRDPRPPIFYLRSFREDPDDDSYESSRTMEEMVTMALKDVGPVVAVGNPSDKTAVLGAARFYLKKGADWQQFVGELMPKAQLVIINPERLSEGLKWEIETAFKHVSSEKILFYLPSYRHQAQDYSKSLLKDAAGEVGAIARQKSGTQAGNPTANATLLFIEPDGTIEFSQPAHWAEIIFGKQSPLVVRETLRPILKRRGMGLGKFPTATPIVLATLLLTSSLTFCVYQVYFR